MFSRSGNVSRVPIRNEAGSQKLEIGDWRLEIGDWRLEIGEL